MNWYRRNIHDYATDTRHLSFMEHGAYNLLLDHLYETEKPLPLDEQKLKRMTGCRNTEEFDAMKIVLKEFFIQTKYGWTHKRFLSELRYVNSKVQNARENGKKGGRPKTYEKPTGFPVATYEEPKANQSETKGEPTRNQTLDFKTLDSKTKDLKTTSNSNANTTPAPMALSVYEEPVVPITLWLSFVEIRKKKKGRPFSEHAGELIRRRLQRFKDDGEDPVEILENTIRNGWMDVYSLKGKRNGQAESFHEKRSRTSAEAIRDIFRSDEHMARKIQRTLPPTDK
jgi:uncharacterized protein YdaU (DUF1376 family)